MMHLKIKIEYPLKFFSMYKYPVKVLKYESYQFSECASIGIVLLRLLLWNDPHKLYREIDLARFHSLFKSV